PLDLWLWLLAKSRRAEFALAKERWPGAGRPGELAFVRPRAVGRRIVLMHGDDMMVGDDIGGIAVRRDEEARAGGRLPAGIHPDEDRGAPRLVEDVLGQAGDSR